MDKDEILKIVTEAIESGSVHYSLSECCTGDCELTLGPIYFHRELPAPPLDPNDTKYIILRGNESPRTKKRLEKKYGGNVEFLPGGTEVEMVGQYLYSIHVYGRILMTEPRNIIFHY